MKPVFLVLLLFVCIPAFTQPLVSGSVKNMQDQTHIPNCPVILKGSDGTLIQIRTDSAGQYTFRLRQDVLYDIYTSTDKTTITPTAKCGFLASEDHGHFETGLDSVLQYVKDFELSPVGCCGYWMPAFLFKKNTTILDTALAYDFDGAIDSVRSFPLCALKDFADMLKRNPTVVIELSAHCSSEETKNAIAADKLSQQRAEKVKTELASHGIDPRRLVAKGRGERKLKIQDAQIVKEKTKAGKEALHAINRRCTIKIIAWDYEDPAAPLKETPRYNPSAKGADSSENKTEEIPAKRMKEHKFETPHQ
ncbi:MAG: outer membrane protein/peptidoglycan-associated protein [Bacteroidetes bacterium]|jgi:outer membrane protein OmpA-like peptidoglycan-associated protein|nr:outer membrane protein/peptidoglycan-associated protein [Bacteroidota bacterium]